MRCNAVRAPSAESMLEWHVSVCLGLLSSLSSAAILRWHVSVQFRLAEQRPGTPLYQKLARDFEARCRADEEETRRKYEEAAAAKRVFTIVSQTKTDLQ
jgi:hypothetical protein